MTIETIEHFESQEISRSIDSSVVQIKANLIGEEDTPTAETAFLAWLGTLSAVSGYRLQNTMVRHLGGGIHEATATYQDDPLDVVKTIRYRTTGATAKVLHGTVPTIYAAAVTGTAPNFGGLINVDKDSVEGVEIDIPSFGFSIDYRFSSVTPAYLKQVAVLTGCVNSSPYLGFDTGELLFKGLEGEVGVTSGGAISMSASPLSFLFEASPNVTNLTVGPFTIPFKYGWDYAWTRQVEDTDADVVIRRIASVHVDRPHRWKNLSLLGI